jgi:ABC-2 type transport system permease protein
MSDLTGTGALIRLILRRDRFTLPIWIVLTALLALASAASFASLYPTTELQQAYAAETASNPAVVALSGPVFAPTLGGLVAWRWTIQGLFLASLASLLTVIRHTRADEQAGRRELLGSTVVGRHAPLTAALIVTFVANLVMAACAASGLTALGLDAGGSIALGLSVAAVACTITAVAGVAAQLTESAGTARGIALAVLVLFYLMRAVGDVGGAEGGLAWLSWLSPIGWARLTRPFAGEQWWVFALFLATDAALITLAYALSARRDLGAGLLPPRLGPPMAAPQLRNPLALAWRLQRSLLLGWSAAFAPIGLAFGFVATTVANLLTVNPQLMDFFRSIGGTARPSDIVFDLYFLTFGPIIGLYAIQATLRLRSEELELRADPVLATPVTRLHWAASHLVFAALGPAAVLALTGLTAGLAYGLSMGDLTRELARVLAGALAYLPAVWVLAGIATAQFGLLPRLAFVSWGAWVIFALIDFAWERQYVSHSVYALSPFAHVPRALLGSEVSALPLLGLIGIAVALMSGGLLGFRRRDVG